ncbi:MAG: hypothetical protein LAO21_14525 [Acidobacteriia bacterium]|nr:hypothetical protein [Terriglobia bacterium]
MINVLTEGLTRIHDEILALRQERGDLIGDLHQEATDRKSAVSQMLATFSKDLSETVRRNRKNRTDFMANLRETVSNLQQEVRLELGEAQQALATLRMSGPKGLEPSKARRNQETRTTLQGKENRPVGRNEAVEGRDHEPGGRKDEATPKKSKLSALRRNRK